MGILCLVLVNQNTFLVNQNTLLENQVESYKTLESMQTVPMPSNGDAGRFIPEKELLYIRTKYSTQQNCELFLHELAHSIQWKQKDQCYYSENKNACEEYAEQYAKENAWRCEEI